MIEPLYSEQIPIQTKDKNDSISQIGHEQLRISFSILNILLNQEIHKDPNKQLTQKNKFNQDQCNKQYVQMPKINKKPQEITSPYKKYHKTTQNKENISNQYLGEYFNPPQILTPKINSNKCQIRMDSSNKSLKRNISIKINKSKNNCQSKQKSLKKNSIGKKIFLPFKFQVRRQKSPSNYQFKLIHDPYSPRICRNQQKNKLKERTKSCKQIIVICHKQKQQKVKQKKKLPFYKLENKQNIISNKDSIKYVSPKINNKKAELCQKGLFSHKQIPPISSDYWNTGIDLTTKKKSKEISINKKDQFKKIKLKTKVY